MASESSVPDFFLVLPIIINNKHELSLFIFSLRDPDPDPSQASQKKKKFPADPTKNITECPIFSLLPACLPCHLLAPFSAFTSMHCCGCRCFGRMLVFLLLSHVALTRHEYMLNLFSFAGVPKSVNAPPLAHRPPPTAHRPPQPSISAPTALDARYPQPRLFTATFARFCCLNPALSATT